MIEWIILLTTTTVTIAAGVIIWNKKRWPLTVTLLRKRGEEWIIQTTKGAVVQPSPGDYQLVTKIKNMQPIPVPSLEVVKPNNTVIMAEVERDQWKPAQIKPDGQIKILPYDHVRWYAHQIKKAMTRYEHPSTFQRIVPYLLIAMLFVGFGLGMYLFWDGMSKATGELNKASQTLASAIERLTQAQNKTSPQPPQQQATW